MHRIVSLCVFGLLLSIAEAVGANERDDWISLSLEPVLDPAVTLVFHGDTAEIEYEDEDVAIVVQNVPRDVGATVFAVALVNKSKDSIRFRERQVSLQGSDDHKTWTTLPLVAAKESKRYCEKECARRGMQGPPPAFLEDATIRPKRRHAGLVEHAHRAGDREYAYYRLCVSAPSDTACFNFENANLQPAGDPRGDPRQPGFGPQWRRRHRGGSPQ